MESDIELPSRAPEINKLHGDFCRGLRKLMTEKAVRIGELLIAQKKECGHGNWLPWIEANLEFSIATAQEYMRCFDNKSLLNTDHGKYLTVHQLANALAKPSQQELEQKQARKKELEEKANAVAKERLEAEKLQHAEEVIENDEVEFVLSSDEDETKEQFEQRVQEQLRCKRLTDEHDGQTVQVLVQLYWESLTKRHSSKEWKKQAAKATVQFLLKKYPQLMDEGI